jgi:hypothetical protein
MNTNAETQKNTTPPGREITFRPDQKMRSSLNYNGLSPINLLKKRLL